MFLYPINAKMKNFNLLKFCFSLISTYQLNILTPEYELISFVYFFLYFLHFFAECSMLKLMEKELLMVK